MALEDRCEFCEFWLLRGPDHPDASKNVGWCRRYPPHVAVDNWPDTKSEGWCGEFKRKVPPVPISI